MSTVGYAQRAGSGMMWVTNFSTHNAYRVYRCDAIAPAKPAPATTASAVSLNVPSVGTNGAANLRHRLLGDGATCGSGHVQE